MSEVNQEVYKPPFLRTRSNMLLKIVINAIKCSTFELDVDENDCNKTFRAPWTVHVMSRLPRNSSIVYHYDVIYSHFADYHHLEH